MKKRISALFLTLAMLLCCSVAVVPSFAEQKPIIILSQESTIGGHERIEVYLENNPGIWGLDLKINYNRDVMTLKNVENGDFFSDSEWTPGNLNAETYILSYEASGLENVTKDSGTLAWLDFEVIEGAALGTYEISASYSAGDIINVSMEEIPFAVENGSITVVSGFAAPYSTKLRFEQSYAICYRNAGPAVWLNSPEYMNRRHRITWENSDESVIEVIQTGASGVGFIPNKPGTVSITATDEIGGESDTFVLTVLDCYPHSCYGKDNAELCAGCRFTDMPDAGNWAHKGIEFAVENKLFSGMDDTTFAPNTAMTRAMLVRVLWKLAGSPVHGEENPFTDVKSSDWFYDGVIWAAENGIVAGMGEGKFAPNEKITREQIAAILYRYTKRVGGNLKKTEDISEFPDAAEVSAWAEDALGWAYGSEIISGDLSNGVTYLRPKNDATRAQVAAMLMRLCNLHGSKGIF